MEEGATAPIIVYDASVNICGIHEYYAGLMIGTLGGFAVGMTSCLLIFHIV